jgi:tetratricopeptide (TPR) repeat protein
MKEGNINFCTAVFEKGNKRLIYLNRRCVDSFSIIIIEEDNTSLEFLASKYYLGNASKYNEDGDFSNSVVASTQALKFNTNNCMAYYTRGLAYYNKSQFDIAIEDCSRAISIDAENSSFYLLRARVFDAKKQIELAIKDLEKAIDLDVDGTFKYLSLLQNRLFCNRLLQFFARWVAKLRFL